MSNNTVKHKEENNRKQLPKEENRMAHTEVVRVDKETHQWLKENKIIKEEPLGSVVKRSIGLKELNGGPTK